MSENLEREGLGGTGTTGTKVRGKGVAVAVGVGATRPNKGEDESVRPPQQRRPGYFKALDSETIPFFFTNFPNQVKRTELWQLFASFGQVGEVFVPNKLDKWGRKFGFVKFKNVSNIEVLEQDLEEVWWGDVHLKVNRARFGRDEVKIKAGLSVTAHGGSKSARVEPGKTFLKALGPMSAQKLGEEVESYPCLEVAPSEDLLEFLQDCCVGFLSFYRDTNQVVNSMKMEGINNILVTEMGDNMVLLKPAARDAIASAQSLHKQWWDCNFLEVKSWAPQMVADRRRVWIRVHGIPLHVWGETVFKLLGSKFGIFLDFDEDSVGWRKLDKARILISTARKGIINEQLNTCFGCWRKAFR